MPGHRMAQMKANIHAIVRLIQFFCLNLPEQFQSLFDWNKLTDTHIYGYELGRRF